MAEEEKKEPVPIQSPKKEVEAWGPGMFDKKPKASNTVANPGTFAKGPK